MSHNDLIRPQVQQRLRCDIYFIQHKRNLFGYWLLPARLHPVHLVPVRLLPVGFYVATRVTSGCCVVGPGLTRVTSGQVIWQK